MHPGGMRSAMDLFDFEKSANLKHPNEHLYGHKVDDLYHIFLGPLLRNSSQRPTPLQLPVDLLMDDKRTIWIGMIWTVP